MKDLEEETEILYETVAPDTAYVSPNDVDAPTNTKTSTASTTASQTNNQIEAKTQNKPALIPDRTKNIKKIQTREGRPNK